jgi:hypothetical protein
VHGLGWGVGYPYPQYTSPHTLYSQPHPIHNAASLSCTQCRKPALHTHLQCLCALHLKELVGQVHDALRGGLVHRAALLQHPGAGRLQQHSSSSTAAAAQQQQQHNTNVTSTWSIARGYIGVGHCCMHSIPLGPRTLPTISPTTPLPKPTRPFCLPKRPFCTPASIKNTRSINNMRSIQNTCPAHQDDWVGSRGPLRHTLHQAPQQLLDGW